MTHYKVTEKQLPEHNQVFAEHPKFGHYRTPYVTWVCLVTGENQSKYFALSNLTSCAPPVEVAKPARTVKPVDMGIVFTVEQAPIQGCELPPPMHIFPMPDMYPQAVWLGIANGVLELAKREVEIRIAVAESELDALEAVA